MIHATHHETGVRLGVDACPGVDERGHGLTMTTLHDSACCHEWESGQASTPARAGAREVASRWGSTWPEPSANRRPAMTAWSIERDPGAYVTEIAVNPNPASCGPEAGPRRPAGPEADPAAKASCRTSTARPSSRPPPCTPTGTRPACRPRPSLSPSRGSGAPVQVRISGAAEDVRKLAEFLAAIPGISASPADIKARPSGIAQGYMTVNLERHDMHAINEDTPAGPGLFEVTRTDEHGNAGRSFITNVRRLAGKERTPGSMVIMAMTWLLVVLDAGLLYVSFAAQYKFVFTEKGQRVPSAIEAGMLDVGMVLLSGLGIGLALAGKPSKSVRFLIMVCAAASAGMNFADADPGSWKSVAAYVAVPVFLAVITDRVIAVIRQHVLPLDAESAWMPLGRFLLAGGKVAALFLLYLLRMALAPAQTLTGLRRMVLDAAPVPGIIEVTGGACGARIDARPRICPRACSSARTAASRRT